jgi:hypothetical protein
MINFEDESSSDEEDGRIALYQLSRQLKEYENSHVDTGSSVSSRQASLSSERKIMDQSPRDTRLKVQKESPLGRMTIEVSQLIHMCVPCLIRYS